MNSTEMFCLAALCLLQQFLKVVLSLIKFVHHHLLWQRTGDTPKLLSWYLTYWRQSHFYWPALLITSTPRSGGSSLYWVWVMVLSSLPLLHLSFSGFSLKNGI
jgi:hypothetical protein